MFLIPTSVSAFRTYKSSRKMLGNFARGILDGELIWMFVMLTNAERTEVIKKIGVKIEDILEDIYEMHMSVSYTHLTLPTIYSV